MNGTVDYSEAGAEDMFEVSSVLARCWRSAYKGLVNDDYLSSLADDHWVEFLTTGLKENSIICHIAKAGRGIIGAAVSGNSITERYPRDGEVISLYVVPEFIGKGVGRSLFEHALRSLKGKGFRHAVICVFAENGKAVDFYKAHGFNTAAEDERINMGAQELRYKVMRKEV